MAKLLGITAFEIRYQARNPVFLVALAVFFLLGFGLTASENVRIGAPGAVHENAPYAILIAHSIFSIFYLFVITAFVANAIVRDETSGFAPIVRATHVNKAEIVLGRFLGGFLIAALGFLALPLGMLAGTLMPWVDPETLGPNRLSYYFWPYLVAALPNIFLLSAVLFALATVLRSMLASYIGAVMLVVGYLVTSGAVGQRLEWREAFARWEPLGSGAFREATRYWTQADMNGRLVEFAGTVAFNRLWAIALGLLFLGITLWRFSMTERAPSRWRLRRLAKREARVARNAAVAPVLAEAPVIARDRSPSRLVQFVARLRTEVRQVLTSPGLIVLALLTVAFTASNLWQGNSAYGTSDFPTLAETIGVTRDLSSVFVLLVAVFYGGELVWRERDRKMNELIDSTAVPSWVMTLPKILAIFLVLVVICLAGMATGVVYLLSQGAPNIGLWQWLAWYVLPVAADMLLIAVLAVVVQVLSPSKYVGWGIIFLWFVGTIFLSNMGYNNPLYTYPSVPSVPLSDFVGQGSFWWGAFVFRLYWGAFAVILAVLAHLLWPRGTDLGLKRRIGRMRPRKSLAPYAILGTAALTMAVTGAYAYHNIKVLNRYETSDEGEARLADYERRYLRFETLPQPLVRDVRMNVELFPRERRMVTEGRFTLVNRSGQPIRDLHLRQGDRDVQYPRLVIPGARLVSNDPRHGHRIFRFDQPLAPGAETTLDFTSVVWRRGFPAFTPETDLLENGTFINAFTFTPIVGMNRTSLLRDRTQRRRQGLPAELRPAKLEDLSATRRNYVGSDWVTSDIRLTTDADQIPIAPGARVSDVTTDGRRTARFVASAPILNFFAIQSARYTVNEEQSGGVRRSVFHQPEHAFNVAKMQRAMRASLAYFGSAFGPYQFTFARIIEFPGYSSFAQAFAGTMPYSESAGFNANTTDPEKIDFTTYVVAHEMAHQWWAHQVVGADMQGATFLSETLAQYGALMVMQKLEGPDKIRRFLKHELDRYLGGRSGEAVEELPLVRVENQQYIHYRKGAVAMFLLQQRLGEEAVNRALARFVSRFRFAGPPYPRSIDLIAEFRREARTPAQQQLITDLFERITLYDLQVDKAATRKVAGGWETTLTLTARKFEADGKGAEREVPLNEPIEVGLFTAQPGLGAFDRSNVLAMGLQPIRSGTQTLTVRSAKRPTHAGLDPYNFYIDRNSEDNVAGVD